MFNMLQQGLPYIWRKFSILISWPMAILLELRLVLLRQVLDDSRTTINCGGLRNWVACNESPHTQQGAHHSACFGCIHKQSGCQMLHQVFSRPWVCIAIWWQWKHGDWEVSKTEKDGNANINKVLDMRPGLGKIIQTVHISRHPETPETDLHIAANVSSADEVQNTPDTLRSNIESQPYWLSCGALDTVTCAAKLWTVRNTHPDLVLKQI